MDPKQIRQLQVIGATLQQARQEQGIPLEEVYAKTFVQLRLLKALEVANVDLLPEPIFVQGFIKRYANLLGLDGASLSVAFMQGSPIAEQQSVNDAVAPVDQPNVSQLPKELPPVQLAKLPSDMTIVPPSNPAQPANSKLATNTPLAPLPELKQLKLKESSLSSSPWFKPPTWVYFVAGMAALGVGLVYFFNNAKLRNQVAMPPSSSSPLSKAETFNPSQAVASETSPLTPESPIQLEIKLTGESWLEVEIDGKKEFEGLLKKGEERNWQAKSELNLYAGNAGDVMVSFNGSAAKPLGSPGEVGEATYKPQSKVQ